MSLGAQHHDVTDPNTGIGCMWSREADSTNPDVWLAAAGQLPSRWAMSNADCTITSTMSAMPTPA